jgi:hypothetical protein
MMGRLNLESRLLLDRLALLQCATFGRGGDVREIPGGTGDAAQRCPALLKPLADLIGAHVFAAALLHHMCKGLWRRRLKSAVG